MLNEFGSPTTISVTSELVAVELEIGCSVPVSLKLIFEAGDERPP